jgi:hypothetical protein
MGEVSLLVPRALLCSCAHMRARGFLGCWLHVWCGAAGNGGFSGAVSIMVRLVCVRFWLDFPIFSHSQMWLAVGGLTL